MPIDHVELTVKSSLFPAMKAFYDAALAPLGYTVKLTEGSHFVGYGDGDSEAHFFLGANDDTGMDAGEGKGKHVGFKAEDKATIKAFYDAALQAGGKDNGAPGPRPQYDPGYYGAFVFDPAGNNIEAVKRDADNSDEQ